jgi:hypothetical protein
VARIREKGSAFSVLARKSEGKGHFQDLDLNGKMILRWSLKQQDWRTWTGYRWRVLVGTVSEHTRFVNCGLLLD